MEKINFPKNFIYAGKEFSTLEEWVNAPLFRKKFMISEEDYDCLQNAEILIGVCGFYELYLNGRNITKGALAPYISNVNDLIYYDKIDVTGMLQKGCNVLGIWLGNGLMNNPGGFVWDFDKAAWRGAPRFAMELCILSKDGSERRISSDETFLTAPSPILFDDYRVGEVYDARLEKEAEGWNMPEYDDSAWENAQTAPAPLGEAKLCTAEPIRHVAVYKPKEFHKIDGGWLFDFGLNTTGLTKLKIQGHSGQKIVLHHGDHLLDDGRLDTENTTCDLSLETNVDVYICKDGWQEYQPRFAYYGFQYVYAEGLEDDQVSEDTLTYIEMYSDLKERGGFACSDPCLNWVQEATRRSTLSNFMYFPNDCPQREKNGWTGDAAVSAEHTLLNLEAEHSYGEWLHNIRKAQREDGALPGIVPTGGWGFAWGNGPAWDCVLTVLPYYIYQYRGDMQIINENAHAIQVYLDYLTSRRREDGLISIGLGDWCQTDHDSGRPDTPLEVTDTLISLDMCRKAQYLFEEAGLEPQRKFAKQFGDELREAARRELIERDTMYVRGHTQTGQVLGLAFGLFEEEERQQAFDRLQELIVRYKGRMNVGILGARHLFHILSEFGYSDQAGRMIIGPEFPSYGYWRAKGATALWEDFRRDGEVIHSRNHHFWGDVSHWLISVPGGIRYSRTNGKAKAVISPCFINDLSWVNAWHLAPEGRIEVKWERQEECILLTLQIPEELEGTIELAEDVTMSLCFEDKSITKTAVSGVYRIVRKEN